jgi:1-deoxy-D-xylulose-5-phosphate reductoisomerase
MAKKVVIIGSTGSIGKSALNLFDKALKDYKVLAISANENAVELRKQVKKYSPKYAVILDKTKEKELKRACGRTKVLTGYEGLADIASLKEADIVLISVVGAAGIKPLMAAIKAGKKIALANKESLIIAGDIIKAAVKKYGAEIIPVDSEHSAIFQCLQGNKIKQVKKLIITASGGPFINHPAEQLKKVTVKKALTHPTWKMGRKITIDSGTLMNKGLEVIEAHYLFDIPYEKIGVVIHPQSIVHSMVEYIDGSVIAQMSNPDMRLPIMYALTYPERKNGVIKPLKLTELKRLEFHPVDLKKFRAFGLAVRAGKTGGTMPACMNAANEVAVKNFLDERISFDKIPYYIEKAMNMHKTIKNADLNDIMDSDKNTRKLTEDMINA